MLPARRASDETNELLEELARCGRGSWRDEGGGE